MKVMVDTASVVDEAIAVILAGVQVVVAVVLAAVARIVAALFVVVVVVGNFLLDIPPRLIAAVASGRDGGSRSRETFVSLTRC